MIGRVLGDITSLQERSGKDELSSTHGFIFLVLNNFSTRCSK